MTVEIWSNAHQNRLFFEEKKFPTKPQSTMLSTSFMRLNDFYWIKKINFIFEVKKTEFPFSVLCTHGKRYDNIVRACAVFMPLLKHEEIELIGCQTKNIWFDSVLVWVSPFYFSIFCCTLLLTAGSGIYDWKDESHK